MPNTFSVADARSEFSKILDHVATTGGSVTVVRYGKPVAEIVPPKKRMSKEEAKRKLTKYAGIWSGPGYEWTKNIGRRSRYFRNRNFWK